MIAAPYVDNSNLLTTDPDLSERVLGAVEADLLDRDFALRDRVVREPVFEFVGVVLDGRVGRLRHKPRRSWRLLLAWWWLAVFVVARGR